MRNTNESLAVYRDCWCSSEPFTLRELSRGVTWSISGHVHCEIRVEGTLDNKSWFELSRHLVDEDVGTGDEWVSVIGHRTDDPASPLYRAYRLAVRPVENSTVEIKGYSV